MGKIMEKKDINKFSNFFFLSLLLCFVFINEQVINVLFDAM